MKRNIHNIVRGIKIVGAIFLIALLCFFTIAMKVKQKAEDIWKQLGIAEMQAKQNINFSFNYGKLSYLGAKNAKNILSGDRVALVNQLVAYSKKYWNSAEFKTQYKDQRTKSKPEDPVKPTITAESIKAEEKVRLEKALKVAEEGLNSTNPKIKNGAPTRIENVKKELKALDDPNNATIKRRLDDANRSYEYAMKLHGTAMAKYLVNYPEDPRELLKKRLQEILTITEDVDYAAELKDVNKLKMFVNPEYEKKPLEWKHAYRAGKAATDAVRAAAAQWLKELN